jgi:hypothetical protein
MTDFLLMVGGALFAMLISGIVNYKKSAWIELTKEEYDEIYQSNKDNIYRAMMVVATYLKRKNK